MTEKMLLHHLYQNPFVLAPMAGITDCSFRSFMREMGCGIVVTELVSAMGLKYSSEKTRALMAYEESQRPIGIQLFGEDLESFSFAAREAEIAGADFVDLNFGCPVPKVVKKGAGAAMLKDLKQLAEVLRTVKQAVNIPVTIKIRTGWDELSRNAHEIVKIAANEGITWVAIHGRTRAQGYSGQADWDYIRYVKSVSPIPVLGNGDIHSGSQARMRLDSSLCDGVLIGRGCLKNPWIFREAKGQEVEKNYEDVLLKLIEHLKKFNSERIVMLQIKKFATWYSAGFPESSAFRSTVFKMKESDQLIEAVFDYYRSLKGYLQKDTSQEAFLMGGHG